MISGEILLSTAYFPPVKYISLIAGTSKAFIEREENYLKQTFRNRCIILAANGPQILSVPVLEGSFHKRSVKDIRIDYSRRWKQVHLRSIISAYRSSPFFDFYFTNVEEVINRDHRYLIDLNYEALAAVLKIAAVDTTVLFTTEFKPADKSEHDFRYLVTPKGDREWLNTNLPYMQVFGDRFGFTDGLSILDLIFNTGPDTGNYLKGIPIRI